MPMPDQEMMPLQTQKIPHHLASQRRRRRPKPRPRRLLTMRHRLMPTRLKKTLRRKLRRRQMRRRRLKRSRMRKTKTTTLMPMKTKRPHNSRLTPMPNSRNPLPMLMLKTSRLTEKSTLPKPRPRPLSTRPLPMQTSK